MRAGRSHAANKGEGQCKPAAVDATHAPLGAVQAPLPCDVVAIGGITVENARHVIAARTAAAAVITDPCDAPDFAGRASAYRELIESRP